MCRGAGGHRLGHLGWMFTGRLFKPAHHHDEKCQITGTRAPYGESCTPDQPSAPARVVEEYGVILFWASAVVGGGSHGA